MARSKQRKRTGTGKSNGTDTTANGRSTSTTTGTSTGTGTGTGHDSQHLELASEPLQQMTNNVRVDVDALTLEAEAVAAEAAADLPPPPPAGEPGAPEPEIQNAEAGYKMLALAVVSQGYELFCPNWHVTPLEKGDMSDALVQALMLWFPDGLIPPKYVALLVIAGVGAKIAIARRDPVTGEFMARHVIPQPATAPAAPSH